jgi:fatty acid amide hydrolase
MPPLWRELRDLGAVGLARAIAAGRVSARDAVEAHVRRVEETTPFLNAVVVPRFEEARSEASAADERQARGEPLGPLHGVPVTVKESLFLAGTPSTAGLPGRRSHQAGADAPIVARLRRAGAIVLGKTNVPQLLLDIECDNPVYGLTRNPWGLDRSPAGSSGGEAANLAAGGAALGLGTDIGGSIRIPAHACGVHGLKPTSLRLSLAGSVDALLTAGQEAMVPAPGPLARHVEDLSLALSVLAAPGQETFDPTLPPVPLPSPAGVRIEHLRIGFYTDDGWFPASRACQRAVREAAAALAARGARVEEFSSPDVSEAMRLFFGLLSAAGSSWAKAFLDAGPVDPRLRERIRVSGLSAGTTRALARVLALLGQPRRARVVRALGRRSTAGYRALVADRARYRDRFFAPDGPGRFDAWLGPPAPTPALRHGASRFLFGGASYTMVSNLLGLPAGVVAATRVRRGEDEGRPGSRDPLDRAARAVDEGSAGLPVGVHVAARPWREDLVLCLMAALEEDFRTRPDYPDGPPL